MRRHKRLTPLGVEIDYYQLDAGTGEFGFDVEGGSGGGTREVQKAAEQDEHERQREMMDG